MAGRARHSIFVLYLASAVFVTVQQGVVGRSNNFKVFRAAAVNLLAHRDLYAAHPDQHFDFYKYSPTFALLFAPLAALPFAPALLIWSLLNSLLLWHAVRRLLPERQATLALALVYLEVLFAMQYTQSNGLVTALILLAFLALEQGRQPRAALLIGLDAFIKIFPLGAAALALFHPRRWRFTLLLAAVGAGLALLPLVVARVVRHRLHGAGDLVCGQRARSRAQRDRARGRDRAGAAGRADRAVGRPRRAGPVSRQGHSLPRRLDRDANGAAGVAPLTRPRSA